MGSYLAQLFRTPVMDAKKHPVFRQTGSKKSQPGNAGQSSLCFDKIFFSSSWIWEGVGGWLGGGGMSCCGGGKRGREPGFFSSLLPPPPTPLNCMFFLDKEEFFFSSPVPYTLLPPHKKMERGRGERSLKNNGGIPSRPSNVRKSNSFYGFPNFFGKKYREKCVLCEFWCRCNFPPSLLPHPTFRTKKNLNQTNHTSRGYFLAPATETCQSRNTV